VSTTDTAPHLASPPSRVADATRRLLGAAHHVTRPVLLGVEHVPADGPFLLVGNHTLLGLQDAPSMVHELERLRGVRVRALGDHAHFAVPGWRDVLVRLGVVRGTRANCAALMRAGEPILVFPGGAREVFKRRGERYRLLWGERLGFARLAIEHGYPIVPFGAVGADDRFDVVLDSEHPVAAPLRALTRRLGRTDVGTVLVRGVGPTLVPRPERLYFRFGAPIETTRWAGQHEDPASLRELRDLARAAVEDQIAHLLDLRERDPHRGLLPRVGSALRRRPL
jgi:1-acyl-sn-glycerol-3-phosphate acyltransferase